MTVKHNGLFPLERNVAAFWFKSMIESASCALLHIPVLFPAFCLLYDLHSFYPKGNTLFEMKMFVLSMFSPTV
jgi:hypothetical protein